MEEEARERTSCTSFVRCNDMWLAKDNRFLNPMSTYERNLMAPTCLIINNYYGATDILFQTLLTLQPGPYFLSLFIFWLLVFSSVEISTKTPIIFSPLEAFWTVGLSLS
jgi:hypothetical protein